MNLMEGSALPIDPVDEAARPRYAIAEGFCEGVIPVPATCAVLDLYVVWTPEPPASARWRHPAAECDKVRGNASP